MPVIKEHEVSEAEEEEKVSYINFNQVYFINQLLMFYELNFILYLGK